MASESVKMIRSGGMSTLAGFKRMGTAALARSRKSASASGSPAKTIHAMSGGKFITS